MPEVLLTQIKFLMDSFAHQILTNQVAMMDALTSPNREDSVRLLQQRIRQSHTMLGQIEGRHEAEIRKDQL
jgi:hypothetical protein